MSGNSYEAFRKFLEFQFQDWFFRIFRTKILYLSIFSVAEAVEIQKLEHSKDFEDFYDLNEANDLYFDEDFNILSEIFGCKYTPERNGRALNEMVAFCGLFDMGNGFYLFHNLVTKDIYRIRFNCNYSNFTSEKLTYKKLKTYIKK